MENVSSKAAVQPDGRSRAEKLVREAITKGADRSKVAGAEGRKLSRLKLLEKGLCQVCGTPRAEGHQTLCEEHRQRHNEYVRRFAYRRAHNLCTICGGRKAFAAKPRCEKCSGKPRSQARR